MEDNSNMPCPTISETVEVGGKGKDVSDLVGAADLVEVFGNDDSRNIGISSAVNNSISLVLTVDQYGQCIWREYR